MSLKIVRTLLTAAGASLLMISCGGEESTPEPKAETPAVEPAQQDSQPERAPAADLPSNEITEKMDPDGKAMHLTATNPSGKKFQASIGDEVDIPEGFPEDVPIFPGSKPMASMSSPDEGMIVTFKTTDEQQAVFDFYQSNLENDGWELQEGQGFGSQLAVDGFKDGRKVSVVVGGIQGDTRVSVIVTSEN